MVISHVIVIVDVAVDTTIVDHAAEDRGAVHDQDQEDVIVEEATHEAVQGHREETADATDLGQPHVTDDNVTEDTGTDHDQRTGAAADRSIVETTPQKIQDLVQGHR